MKIKAGAQEIEISNIRTTDDYATITIQNALTQSQLDSLLQENWELYEIYTDTAGQTMERFLNSVTGYNKILEMSLTLERTVPLQKDILQKEEIIKEIVKEVPDELAVKYKEYFDAWQPDTEYAAGERLRYEENLFKVVQAHTSQADWLPDVAKDLYTIVNDPNNEEYEHWEPHKSYDFGVILWHNDILWISKVQNNTWEPGAEGVNENIWAKWIPEEQA